MPPVRKGQKESIRKRVDFVAKDDDEQKAIGIVMVPDKVDLQGDFVRDETIAGFADQFENFVEVDEADGGIMHAAWPSEWMDLDRNLVLDSATEINGATAPAGAWIQEWSFHDDGLWELVADDVISGFSIGAVSVEWKGPFGHDEVENVEIPDEIGDDEPVWELTDGIIREVSAVDIPAVPDAMILETKSEYEKRLADHLGNRDGFVAEAMERGHSEEDAERLWDVLNRAVDVEGAGEPGKQSFFERVGKSVVDALKGDASADDARAEDLGASVNDPTAKEGRTLSAANRDDLKAVVDAAATILQDGNVDTQITRFTDRDDDPFDLSEHQARSLSTPEDEEDEENGNPFGQVNNSGDPDAGNNGDDTSMSDDPDDPMEEAPEWAKAIADQVESNTEQINEHLGGDDPLEDAPEWGKALAENVEQNAEAIEEIASQGGKSQQLAGGGPEPNGEPEDFGDAFGKAILSKGGY